MQSALRTFYVLAKYKGTWLISANVKAVHALDDIHFMIEVETFYHIGQQLQTLNSEHDGHKAVAKSSRG